MRKGELSPEEIANRILAYFNPHSPHETKLVRFLTDPGPRYEEGRKLAVANSIYNSWEELYQAYTDTIERRRQDVRRVHNGMMRSL